MVPEYIDRPPSFCKLLRVDHHLKDHQDLVPGLREHYYDVVCHALAAGLDVTV